VYVMCAGLGCAGIGLFDRFRLGIGKSGVARCQENHEGWPDTDSGVFSRGW